MDPLEADLARIEAETMPTLKSLMHAYQNGEISKEEFDAEKARLREWRAEKRRQEEERKREEELNSRPCSRT